MQISAFIRELPIHLPKERIVLDEVRRFALSTDASFYRLTPQVIVQVDSEHEMITLLHLAARYKVPLTFRAAGTSLSGQAVTDSVLVMLTDSWLNIKIEPMGETIHIQPGVIGAKANRALLPYGRKIGPDPASINACKLGGIIANNASGMCCGTKHNSYHTLKGMRIILADGSLLDTREVDSINRFRKSHKKLLDELKNIQSQLLENVPLAEKIRHKYRLKNTTGYGLNALLDFDDPIEILSHLMVGSEGTLGFLSDVSLRTVEDLKFRASSFVAYDDLNLCATAVSALKSEPVEAVELLDARAIASVSHMAGLPSFTKNSPEKGGVLLIDIRASSAEELEERTNSVSTVINQSGHVDTTGFTTSKNEIDSFWRIRKGTFPAVGAMREAGTTVIIEDVAFPIERLAEGVDRLQKLFDKYQYNEAIIFGHALEGNLHFVFTQAFDDDSEVSRYESFMDDVTKLVAVEFGGSLKAEHGTGRNMAPFVAREWGDDAFGIMKQLKQLLDPKNILNPGVIINNNAKVHIENLKLMPVADESIDKCIECGFCEEVCPSKNFTLTPRQRISVYRETVRRQSAKEHISTEWGRDFQFLAVDSCAATGLCEIHCPVDINTGELILKIRSRRNYRFKTLAKFVARHFAVAASWVRIGLLVSSGLQKIIGAQRLENFTRQLRKLSRNRFPVWLAATPGRAQPIYAGKKRIDPTAENTVVYWASCVSQSMGGAVGENRGQIPIAIQSVLEKADLSVVYPQPTRGLCCGQPFKSKGHSGVAGRMMSEVIDELWAVSSGGRYPVLSDTSPCALQLREEAKKRGIHLYDSSEFIDRFLLDRLSIKPATDKVAIHVTCSTQKQGIENSFKHVVDKLVPNWIQPVDINCCGFAGDKGFTLPELNESALKPLAGQVGDCAFGISTSRTCEIGLSASSGITYYSLFEILDKHSTKLTDPEDVIAASNIQKS